LIVVISLLSVKTLVFSDSNDEKSIAVLPLHNLTGETSNNFLVDGLHDALIGELGKIGLLRVISRTSTLRYRESNKLLSEIAEELDVNTILESSVIGAGDTLSILIQLIDVFPKERHILSGEYREGMSNVLNLQSSVVKDIARSINVKLSEKEDLQLNKSRTVNPETYKSYLRGMYFLSQGTTESSEKGMKYLKEAIKRDPGDPFAYAGLALGYATMGHGLLKSEDVFLFAKSSAEKAIKLDPTSDEALTALGVLYLDYGWDWPKAKETLERALTNNPSNAMANAHLAWYYVLFGDFENAVYYGKKAVMVDPLSATYSSWLAFLYIHINEYDLAEKYARKALSLQENIPYGNYALGKICILKGQYEQAIEYHEKLPSEPYYKMMRGYAYVKAGQRGKALELWKELEDHSKKNHVNSCYRGMMAAYLGFTDIAFELLNEAVDRKEYPIMYINTYIYSEDIRKDPRFNKLLLRMNLPARKLLISANESITIN
jgi:TolB-like protein/Flp pilus assembly protein TadD